MPAANAFIGQVFNDLADLLEIQGANPFRIRAYRNAARIVSQFPLNLSAFVLRGEELPKLPGLGADLNSKVAEIIQTGRLSLLEQTQRKVPKGLGELLKIPGLGPRRVLALRKRFRIRGIKDLRILAKKHKIRELPGFGEKTEGKILQEIQKGTSLPKRFTLSVAEQFAEPLLECLRKIPGVKQLALAGSYRRKQETVGDLDILVAYDLSTLAFVQMLTKYEDLEQISAQGESKITLVLNSGVQVDIRVIPSRSYGAALHYFTGSKNHNIAIRTLGIKLGLKINEYGIFKRSKMIAGKTEEEVFASVGLPYIEPELRENRGEIEAAREGCLPRLIKIEDIRGDLHSHTNATDGRMTLLEMAEAAEDRGYEYLAITDHSRHLSVAQGLTPERLKKQLKEIDRLNSRLNRVQLLKAIEVDILEDGRLDLPDSILSQLDLTVCSIHFKFDLPEAKQTERVIRAMDHPCFDILGHPTGRLIGKRRPYAANLEKIFHAAKERGCFVELDSQPDRLDLNDIYCKLAKDVGVKISISTDAHSIHELDFMRFGVSQARRGWLEKADVLNTLSWNELIKILRKRPRR